ncbi:polyphosphate polymerase domain-containing protein [uncultured Draconibacterium sp.]|uniref:polyphosphate polymerase domain-containing protein n=1 Tax=uncultured Draconibacterium sp. TaxID=1573823 RepID=UPI002AA8DAB8|nr:polyphosphate polymerase domain-containing protein [uncultured Draconibacterium sp.]
MSLTALSQQLDAISLDEMNEVALLNRFDSKYQLSVSKLEEVLEAIKNDYYILEINGKRKHKYNTIYYDTSNDSLYTNHHNGRLNRLKIRKREYVDSELAFLEIKKKNNKGKTKKLRMTAENRNASFTAKELHFLTQNTNFDFHLSNFTLRVKNINSFERITLVNKDFSERCTIDIHLVSYSHSKKLELGDMAVVELKQGKTNVKTPLGNALSKSRVKPRGFSKYCIGRAFLEPDLKRNLFKERLLQLKKQFKNDIVLTPLHIKSTLTFIENNNYGSDTGYNYQRAAQVAGH